MPQVHRNEKRVAGVIPLCRCYPLLRYSSMSFFFLFSISHVWVNFCTSSASNLIFNFFHFYLSPCVQLQTAVREMEKALVEPQNVAIYKQHWDVYARQPLLLEKLKLENPVMFHLLQHFRSPLVFLNLWSALRIRDILIRIRNSGSCYFRRHLPSRRQH